MRLYINFMSITPCIHKRHYPVYNSQQHKMLSKIVSQTTKKFPPIGFIGLGQMGGRMVENLSKKYPVPITVLDTNVESSEIIEEQFPKTVIAKSPAEMARYCEVIFTMLPTNDSVKETHLGRNGTLSGGLLPGTKLIDCSTINKNVWLDVSKEILGKYPDVRTYDAPVSGGIIGAQNGTLSFLVGANEERDVSLIRPFLEPMGKNIFHCGKPGSGQVAKLCNNLILGITMGAVSEAMNLGIREGLSPNLLNEIFEKSTGQSWVTRNYNPVPGVHPNSPASNDYAGGFSTNLIIKDLSLAEELGKLNKADLPLTSLVNGMYKQSLSDSSPKDFSFLYQKLSNN